jgi:hypothetical protein
MSVEEIVRHFGLAAHPTGAGIESHESNRVDRITSDGHIVYRQTCSGSEPHIDHDRVSPVLVPESDGVGVHAGEGLQGFARSASNKAPRSARIWLVGKRVLRIANVAI